MSVSRALEWWRTRFGGRFMQDEKRFGVAEIGKMRVAITRPGRERSFWKGRLFLRLRDFYVFADRFNFAAADEDDLVGKFASFFGIDKFSGANGGGR